jgi:hypothetical protein
MPLKEADLTSLQACKRAFSKDAQEMRTVGALRAWIYQKVGVGTGPEKETFALFPVLLDNRGVRNVMAQNGSEVLCQGTFRVTPDGRTLAFETDAQEMNADLAGVLKKAIASLMPSQDVVIRLLKPRSTSAGQ